MSITKLTGDLLKVPCLIRCHQVNCRGVMGAGLAKQVKTEYPEVFSPYRDLCSLFGSKLLGHVQVVPCHDKTVMVNLFAQDDYGGPGPNTDMVALETCLTKLAGIAKTWGSPVALPHQLGAGLAGGNWAEIEALIARVFADQEAIIVSLNEEDPEPRPVPISVSLYTDGACSGNPGPGGWAGILVTSAGAEKTVTGYEAHTTNNRMELMAVIQGLETLNRPCVVQVVSDSKYVVDAINLGWLAKWKAQNWRRSDGPVVNPDLWQRLDAQLSRHTVTFTWTKGHADNPYNNRCDKLATDCVKLARERGESS